MARNEAMSVSLFCFFAMACPATAQQTVDSHGEATGAMARAGVNGVGVPQCIHCQRPSYSKKARAAKYEGTVLLDVTVTADGLGLTEKALTQVKKWKMKPAIGQDGKPVDCRVQIEVTFHLY